MFAVIGALLWVGQSLGSALIGRGSDSLAARAAEWARYHHLGAVVTELERVQYALNPPRKGGLPAGGVPRVASGAAVAPPSHAAITPAPSPIPPQASPALPGEGRWQTLATVHGRPAVRAAFLRPDNLHTSYLTGVAWMDPRLLRFEWHPGTQVPGGSGWATPPSIPATALSGLVGTFNAGFTMQDGRGGVWEAGKQVRALRPGAASFVIYRDGRADVGSWGRDAHLGADVMSVRQNLDLIVDGGALVPGLDSNRTSQWGRTLGNKDFVWRSAVGVTRTGALVYVAGAALSAKSLAALERAAGALRAMELDINPEWTSFMTYTHPSPDTVVPHLLTADEQPKAGRYLQTSTRDFFAVYGRPCSRPRTPAGWRARRGEAHPAAGTTGS